MSQRVLLIQRDAVAATAVLDALTHFGDESFQVKWVKRCSEALERLDGIVAILVDPYLPDSRGIETFERLFRAAPSIPILLLIEPQHEGIAKLAVRFGAQDYLLKDRLDARLVPKIVATMLE